MFVVEYMVLVFVGLRRLLTFGVLVLTWGGSITKWTTSALSCEMITKRGNSFCLLVFGRSIFIARYSAELAVAA